MNERLSSISFMPQTIAPVSRGDTIRQILRILRRHMRFFAVWFILVLAIGIAAIFSLRPSFTATAVVSIAQPNADPLAANNPPQQNATEAGIIASTEAAMMQSRDVAASVLAQYPPPAQTPRFGIKSSLCQMGVSFLCHKPTSDTAKRQGAIDGFLKSLTVSPRVNSRIIDVQVTSSSGQRASDLANAVVANFQTLQLAQQTQNINRVTAWLDDRTATLQGRWQDAVKAANDYSLAHNLTNASQTGASTPLINSQVSNMADSLGAAQARLAAAQARAEALRDATQKGNTGALVSLSDQPVLVAAATNLMTLQNSRNQLSAEFGPGYPRIKALNAEIAQTQALVSAQTKAALGSIQADLIAAQAEVNQLNGNLKQLTTHAGAQSASQAQFQALSQEADSARTIYETFLEHENDIVDKAALLQPPVELVSHASIPSQPTFPNKTKLGLGVLIIAMAAGVAAVFAKNYFSQGFQEVDELQALVPVPLLATLPKVVAPAESSIANYVTNAPFSRAGEAVRGLITKLALLAADNRSPRSVLVASAAPAEGKSTLSIWLAKAARQGGQSVLVIDGDHQRGGLLPESGGLSKLGLTDLLTGRTSIEHVIYRDTFHGLDHIVAGSAMTRPFGSEEISRFQLALAALKLRYNLIIIDSPPLLAMTDALVYGSVADQTVFVCRWQQTSRNAVTASIERLRAYGARVAGIVVTMTDDHSTLSYGGEYGKREAKLIGRYYGSGADA